MKLSKEGLTKAEFKYYKEHGTLPPSSTEDKHITILCVRFGNRYGPEYVERLRNMISRNITIPYEIVCLTDDPRPIKDVRLIVQGSAGYSKLWWHKVHMFDPSLPLRGRILYFDLDIIICDNIDRLALNTQPASKHSDLGDTIMGIQDFNRAFYPGWKILNSSAMSWMHGRHSEIWDNFKTNPKSAQRLHGDQDWIWQQARHKIIFWPKEWIQSYKWEIRSREELVMRNGSRGFKSVRNDITIPKDCSVLVFHGDPKPQDIQDKIVLDYWK
jgi:hypothetical protein